MPQVVVEEEAETELLQATVWYEQRRSGLAREFLEEVTRTLAIISRTPALFPALVDLNLEKPVRRALVRRFPYALIFIEGGQHIHVIAAAHARRAPGYWLHRVIKRSS